jgi:hypothetical protein
MDWRTVAADGQRMMIGGLAVVVAPGLTVTLTELPAYSIALDGVVQGPALDLGNHRLSFDHHGDCIRLVTSATCRQVADALLLGLDPRPYTAYVNDTDGDTVLAVALLAHPAWLDPAAPARPHVRRLVEAVAGRDAHGTAYPVAEPGLLAAFADQVPLPVGTPAGATGMAAELRRCVDAVASLVEDLTEGRSSAASTAGSAASPHGSPSPSAVPSPSGRRPVPSFTVTHTGTGWVMATSDADAFDQVYEAGHTRVVMWRRRADGSTAYTVGRRSDLVDGFPVGPAADPGTILGALAAREPGWGGGSSIGGAPRHPDGRRSSLPPDEVFAIVEEVVTAAVATVHRA